MEDKKSPADLSKERIRPEFTDASVLCQYHRILTRQESVLGYDVQLSFLPQPSSMFRAPICRSEVQFLYSLRFNKFVVESWDATQDKLPDEYSMHYCDSFESKSNRGPQTSRQRADSTTQQQQQDSPKGYYKQVQVLIQKIGIDPASVPLWKTVSFFLCHSGSAG